MTIASTTPAAQSDDPVLDELIGTATNTALLPEPDAHAYDDIATGDADPLVLGGHKFTSRFILGSGRYDLNLIKATIENAGTQIVTMALRRCRTTENNLLDYIPKGITMLPNTSGARNAEEAVRIARLARESARRTSSRSRSSTRRSTCCPTTRRRFAPPRCSPRRASW